METLRLSPRAYRLLRPWLVFVTTCIFARFFGELAQSGQLIYVWPVTGVQLALLLSSSQTSGRRRLEILAAAGAIFVTSLTLHNPLWIGLFQAVLQAFELSLLLKLLGSHVQCFDDLKKRSHVVRFLLASTLIPVLTTVTKQMTMLSHTSIRQVFTGVALSDSLGIAVFTPVCLFLLSGKLWRKDEAFQRFQAGLGASLLLVSAALTIFCQTTDPILFMIFPPLIVAVFVLGLRGAIFASLVSTVIACSATAVGRGPVWLMHGVTLEHRVLVLQIFLWAIVATALPVGSLLDEQRASEQEAHKNQAIYETLLENSNDMIILSSLDGSSRFVSPAVEKVTGWTSQEYSELPPLGHIHEEDRDLARSINGSLGEGKSNHTFRYRAMHKDGSFRWVEAFIRGFRDSDGGPIKGYVATVHDISDIKRTEDSWSAEKHELASKNEELADLAGRDELTGIANRRTFNRVLGIDAGRQCRSSDSLSLLMIDVDSFKKFNDRYGHQAGDECLRKVAQVFGECAARKGDLAARVGGEEFAVLLPQTNEAGSIQVATDILEGVRKLGILHEDSVSGFVSVSIGLSTWLPYQTSESTKLIQQADRALYESKRTGRNRLTIWSAKRQAAAQESVSPNPALAAEPETPKAAVVRS